MPAAMQNLSRLLAIVCISFSGCALTSPPKHPAPIYAPKELEKAVLPPYRIEPPDVLVIGAVHLSPPPSYPLRSGDLLYIQVPINLIFEFAPIDGEFPVGPGGLVNLGPHYGAVSVAGMTVEQARTAIKQHLQMQFQDTEITLAVALSSTAGLQQVEGQHLVSQDGTVTLGMYGSVSVIGMTIEEAKFAIEQFLRRYFENPQVSVDVIGYNSHVYYVVTAGAGLGDSVVKLPVTGNETVLDGLANINGIPQVSSKRIWVARPGYNRYGQAQILPVDYEAITRLGDFSTNYQLLPGDRLFIEEDSLVALDTSLAKLFAPMERLMGFSLLTVGTTTRFSGPVLRGGGAAGQGAFGAGTF
jgi:polysaccharide export outer membrane protein